MPVHSRQCPTFTAAKSFTFTAVCDEPYPVYRQEFKNAAGTARLGGLREMRFRS